MREINENNVTASSSTPQETTQATPSTESNNPRDVMDWLDDFLEPPNSSSAIENVNTVEFEFMHYSNKPCCRADVIEWWRQKEFVFPILSKLARKYLCVPASSVPSERIFSTTGNIVNKKRACLSSENVDMLVFLNKNHGLF